MTDKSISREQLEIEEVAQQSIDFVIQRAPQGTQIIAMQGMIRQSEAIIKIASQAIEHFQNVEARYRKRFGQ